MYVKNTHPQKTTPYRFISVVYFASDDLAYTAGESLTASGALGLATSVYGDIKDKKNRK